MSVMDEIVDKAVAKHLEKVLQASGGAIPHVRYDETMQLIQTYYLGRIAEQLRDVRKAIEAGSPR